MGTDDGGARLGDARIYRCWEISTESASIEDFALPAITVSAPANPKFLDVTTELRHFALVTYAVDPQKLSALLPQGFEAEIFTLNDGRRCSFVSAAMFHDFGFRPAFCPWPQFSFEQTNYRAYVRRGDEHCVWFFGTALNTPLVVIPHHFWRLPWHHAAIKISASWQEDICTSYHYVASGKWGNAETVMKGTEEPSGRLDGFGDDEETALILTHPLTGYFRRTDGRLGTYRVWHDRLRMNRAIVEKARFEVFEQLGLIDCCDDDFGAKPHSALIQRSTEFFIYLPPSLV
jgi:uncharacterized protein YqjF (DUF2071 family)